jgi:DhnA family fructose-bisphosphate aldolase class Ia
MLVKLHDLVSVNPANVAAVLCGHMAIALKMTNGYTHNVKCNHDNDCPVIFKRIMTDLRKFADFVDVDPGRAVNVDQVISVTTTGAGVSINVTGEFSMFISTREKRETMNKIFNDMKAFAT